MLKNIFITILLVIGIVGTVQANVPSVSSASDKKYENPNNPVERGGTKIKIPDELKNGLLPPGALNGPKSTDLMNRMIITLIGEPALKSTKWFTNDVSTRSNDSSMTVVSYFASFMSGLALIVAALLYFYILQAGLLNTASDGTFLGQKWSSFWVPLRSGFGVAALYPTKTFGGLSLVQAVTIALALLGVGMASVIFSFISAAMLSSPVSLPNIPSQRIVIDHMLQGQICALIQRDNRHMGAPSFKKRLRKITVNQPGGGGSSNQLGNTITLEQMIYTFSKGDCGGYNLDVPLSQGISNHAELALTAMLGKALSINTKKALKNLWYALIPVSQSIYNNTFVTSHQWIRDLPQNLPALTTSNLSQLETIYLSALSHYEFIVRSSLNSSSTQVEIRKANKKIIAETSRLGFAMAGTYYYTWARYQDQLSNAVEKYKPNIVYPIISFNQSKLSNDAANRTNHKLINNYIEAMHHSAAQHNDIQAQVAASVDDQSSFIGKWTSKISASMAKGISSIGRASGNSTNLNPDPIMDLKSMGDTIINAYSITVLAAMTIKSGSSNIFLRVASGDTAGMANSFVTSLLSLLVTWSIPIVIMGFVYANLMPALPYIMWVTAMSGYLIYVIEAVYASPFWMAMHVHPEGHEVTGKGASGYPILMTLVLRPSFMVGGLVAAMGIVRVMGWFLNQTLFESMRNMGVGSFNLSSMFGMVVIYGVTLSSVIYKSFSLTYELPNAMLRWMGVGQHHADLGENEAQQRTVAAFGAVGQYISKDPPNPPIKPTKPTKPSEGSEVGTQDDAAAKTENDVKR